MKKNSCVPQKISKYFLGLLFLSAALALLVIGVTILPFIGWLLALPVIAIALYIFRVHLNDQCEIDFSAN